MDWSRSGLKVTLYGGLALQIFALLMLALLQPTWREPVSVAYVMAAQALSGIAKDLTKMSAKSAIKIVVPDDTEGTLFKWVSRLTGSKNALKGAGFFVGGVLLATLGFGGALVAMAVGSSWCCSRTVAALPADIGRSKKKVKFTTLFSKSPAINWLSAARLFLFGARDVWFVVGLPVFLSQLGWSFSGLAASSPSGSSATASSRPLFQTSFDSWGTKRLMAQLQRHWAFVFLVVPLGLIGALRAGLDPSIAL